MTQFPPAEEPLPEPEATPQEAAPASGAEDASLSPALGDILAAFDAERAELKDRNLRMLAEMENLRRRTEKEVSDARTYSVANFARDMLGVADNLRRAIETAPPDAEGTLKALIEGVELTERGLLAALERHGVRKLDPQGQKFDPNLHQAMFEAPDASVAKGMVIQVVQPGFTIGERVLRPALVGVSSGAPATANPAA